MSAPDDLPDDSPGDLSALDRALRNLAGARLNLEDDLIAGLRAAGIVPERQRFHGPDDDVEDPSIPWEIEAIEELEGFRRSIREAREYAREGGFHIVQRMTGHLIHEVNLILTHLRAHPTQRLDEVHRDAVETSARLTWEFAEQVAEAARLADQNDAPSDSPEQSGDAAENDDAPDADASSPDRPVPPYPAGPPSDPRRGREMPGADVERVSDGLWIEQVPTLSRHRPTIVIASDNRQRANFYDADGNELDTPFPDDAHVDRVLLLHPGEPRALLKALQSIEDEEERNWRDGRDDDLPGYGTN